MHPEPEQPILAEAPLSSADRAQDSSDAAREHACARVILELAQFTDNGNYGAALALFCDDATMDRDGERINGIDALRQAYAQRPARRMTRHVLTNIVVQLDGPDHAQASSYVTVYRYMVEPDHPGPPYRMPGPDVLGQYQDRLVRTATGWRLASRTTRTIFQFRDSQKG